VKPLRALLPALLLAACGGDDGAAPTATEMPRGADPFVFSTTTPDAYVQVDRMGAPVVATVLLPRSQKDNFNHGVPADDGDFAQFAVPTLHELHFELDHALRDLGFTPCEVDVCVRQAAPKVFPDVLHLRLADPDGFPNGRRLEDSVVDRVLAIALLDVTTPGDCRGTPCTVDSLVEFGLNPSVNDEPLLADFPYLGLPHPPP
jgi:hypothetical protein